MKLPKSNYVQHLEDEIADLRHQRDVLQGKLDRMEVAVMAHESPAGNTFARISLTPQQPPSDISLAPEGSFAYINAQNEKELAELEANQARRESVA